MRECAKLCRKLDVSCPNKDCRQWLNYEDDLNCTLIAVKKHGSMTLREIAKREGISFPRVKQIEDATLIKIRKALAKNDKGTF
jgi:hypothetical protein